MQQESTAGYVTDLDFIAKPLRDEGYALIDKSLGVGRPLKAARVTDLKHSYGPKRGAVRNIGQSSGLSSVKGNRYRKYFARM